MTERSAPTSAPTTDDCEHAVRRLWDYVDRGLPAVARDEVDAHLTTCELCARRFAFARTMKNELAKLGSALSLADTDEIGRVELSRRIHAALRRARSDDGNGGVDA
jgi:anti-sigma factor RsiW